MIPKVIRIPFQVPLPGQVFQLVNIAYSSPMIDRVISNLLKQGLYTPYLVETLLFY